MAIDLKGFDGLIGDMNAMADALGNESKAVREALKSGAKPIRRQMLHNASTDPKIISGALHGSIRTGSIKKGRYGGKRITIGVHHKEMGTYYANPVEFGHGGPAPAPAHPFVRPAFDAQKEEAYDAMKDVLKSALISNV